MHSRFWQTWRQCSPCAEAWLVKPLTGPQTCPLTTSRTPSQVHFLLRVACERLFQCLSRPWLLLVVVRGGQRRRRTLRALPPMTIRRDKAYRTRRNVHRHRTTSVRLAKRARRATPRLWRRRRSGFDVTRARLGSTGDVLAREVTLMRWTNGASPQENATSMHLKVICGYCDAPQVLQTLSRCKSCACGDHETAYAQVHTEENTARLCRPQLRSGGGP